SAMRDIEIVFHLAALIAIPYSYQVPMEYARTNIEGTLNVLLAARQLGIERLIHTSTSEVFGTARYVPIDENHPLQGQSPYAASKIGADKMVEAFFLSFGLPVVTVRPFNTFGPRQSARAIVPAIMAQFLAGQTEIRLGNIHPLRDLNYVSNVADGFILAAACPQAVGEVINLGSGKEISIGSLAGIIGEISGDKAAIKQEGQRMRPRGSEVERLLADNRKAGRLLGWKPDVPLDKGLKLTWEWMKENQSHYRPRVYAV
ncbi:MAG: GDP-mannose 4,6-dehydratase, partial [Elusimicrobia bacterium]|nr:GDP-mannose 4,6-dehydratase [Elusimicrobiota bacterium]